MNKKSDNNNGVDYGKKAIRTVFFAFEGKKYESIQHIILYRTREMIISETVSEL